MNIKDIIDDIKEVIDGDRWRSFEPMAEKHNASLDRIEKIVGGYIKKIEDERDSHLKIISALATPNKSLHHHIIRLEAENTRLREKITIKST